MFMIFILLVMSCICFLKFLPLIESLYNIFTFIFIGILFNYMVGTMEIFSSFACIMIWLNILNTQLLIDYNLEDELVMTNIYKFLNKMPLETLFFLSNQEVVGQTCTKAFSIILEDMVVGQHADQILTKNLIDSTETRCGKARRKPLLAQQNMVGVFRHVERACKMSCCYMLVSDLGK